MKVIINENASVQQLSLIHPESGVDKALEFITDAGAINDGQFCWDAELGAYVCNLATFGKWSVILADHQLLDDRLYALVQEHGEETVFGAIREAMAAPVPVEQVAANINKALDSVFRCDMVSETATATSDQEIPLLTSKNNSSGNKHMSINLKSEANDIANKAVAELGGDWANVVFNNLGWVVQVESKELDLYMNRSSSPNGVSWNVYSKNEGGFVCSAATPAEALIKAADRFMAKIESMEAVIERYRSMIKTIRG